MSETILDFCTVCGTPSAVHVPGGLFCLQKQLAAEKALRHDAMTAYAKLEADWRAEKALREAAEAREEEITRERRLAGVHCILLAKLASDEPAFYNPAEIVKAKLVRDYYLSRPAPEQGGGGDGN